MRQVKLWNIVPMVRNLVFLFVAFMIVSFSVIAGQYPNTNTPYVPALSTGYYMERGELLIRGLSEKVDHKALKVILKTELPVMSVADNDRINSPKSYSILKLGVNLLAGVKLDDPLSLLRSEIPMMSMSPITADSLDETSIDQITEPSQDSGTETSEPSDNIPSAPIKNSLKSDVPLIAIYCTHSSETFEPTDGVAHMKGKAGGITTVAKAIQQEISSKYNIAVAYSSTIHDLSFNKSYEESEKTVIQQIKENPGLKMIIDVHRDGSMTREQSRIKVNGRDVAKVLFVVGTNARAEHPKWRENLEFIRKVAAKTDAMYPGLSRGITIKQGRYNQQHSTHALLVEVGSVKNSTEEAIASGQLLANVFVAVLNDMQTSKPSI